MKTPINSSKQFIPLTFCNFRSFDLEDLDDVEYMKQLQEKFDREEDSYSSLKKQYSSEKEAQGIKLREDDWIWELCQTINQIPKYRCSKCDKENEFIKEIAYQKRLMQDKQAEERYRTRKRPYVYESTKDSEPEPATNFRRTDHLAYLKNKWKCRICRKEQSALSGMCENWFKKKEDCDVNLPHCLAWNKSLKKETKSRCRSCRAKGDSNSKVKEREEPRLSKTAFSPAPSNSQGISYQWSRCKGFNKYSSDWIPYTQKQCRMGHPKEIYWVRWDPWGKVGSNLSEIKKHDCRMKSASNKRNTFTSYGLKF